MTTSDFRKKMSNERKMNKKAIEVSPNTLIICAIGIIVLVVISIIFLGRIGTFKQPFDVNKDVCTKLKRDVDVAGDYIPEFKKEYPNSVCKIETSVIDSPEFNLFRCSLCLSWRPKTKCELDPNADGCICDKEDKIKIVFTKGSPISVNLATGIYTTDVRLGTETLKYKIERHSEVYNLTMESSIDNATIYIVKCVQAHPKTIQDVSCQELKIAILKGYRYNTINNDFGEYPLCKNPDCIDTAQLVDIAIFRRCLSDSRLTIQITGDNPLQHQISAKRCPTKGR